MSFDKVINHLTTNVATPEIIVVQVHDADVERLERLLQRGVPVLVICEERHVDAVQLAGVTDCVINPLRQRELVGRLRRLLRDSSATRTREKRERLKSGTIAALKREKDDLERLACIDMLTGVANRRHALTLLDKEWRRALRDHLSLGVVIIDLDCFHAYNEEYGHIGGDTCLQRVSDVMGKCLHRPADFLGRYGGEEFIAVLPSTDADGAAMIAAVLRAAVERLSIPHARSQCGQVVTISAGFASLRSTPDTSIEQLVGTADAALLRAKAKGRNGIEGDAPHNRIVRPRSRRSRRFTPIHADLGSSRGCPHFCPRPAMARVRSCRHSAEIRPRSRGSQRRCVQPRLHSPCRASIAWLSTSNALRSRTTPMVRETRPIRSSTTSRVCRSSIGGRRCRR